MFPILQLQFYSICAGVTIFFGYIVFSTLLQLCYYHCSRSSVSTWKTQPTVRYNDDSLFPWLPILGRRINRAPEHSLFATLNLLLATTFATLSTELLLLRKGRMYFETDSHRLDYVVTEVLAACFIELILEYIFHRIMHTEFFYKSFHKFHHFYKAPIPFDDMMIHPFEAFLYYCILYCPPFLIQMSPISHGLYMIIMGTCGILDHCGIRIKLPFIYDSVFHDEHHHLFNVNYGFPFSTLDMLMGTYYESSKEVKQENRKQNVFPSSRRKSFIMR